MTDSQQTPMQVLVHLYTEAPNDVRAYLDAKVRELIGVEMPKLSMLKQDGPYMSRSDALTVAEVFHDAMEFTKESMPKAYASLSGTVRVGGEDIAAAVDRVIKGVLLEDTAVNRHAYLTIVSTHAKLVKALHDLPLKEEEQTEYDSESDSKA